LKIYKNILFYINYFNLFNLDRKYIFIDNNIKSDNDFPSLEEFFRTFVPLSKPSTEVSKIENPVPDVAEILVDQTKSGLDEHQGDNPDR
jgi:hypothetical protein